MKNRTNSKIGKNEYLTYQNFLKHARTLSSKSNKPYSRKPNNSRPTFQKMLTQTTSSKYKRTQHQSPTKSRSKSRKSKIQSKISSDKPVNKSMRRSRQNKQKLVMIQSLSIAQPEVLSQEEFLRNSSQQFSTNYNVDHSIWIPDPLVEIFRKTQKTLQRYESSIQSLRKQKLQVKMQLATAKKRIIQLQRELLKRKSSEI